MDGSTDGRTPKRRKIEDQNAIWSAEQLSELLRFRKSISSETRGNISRFKDFLSSINKSELSVQAQQFSILKQYCNDQAAPSKEHIDFPDLLETWAFAVENTNDSICSAVPAVLAQFFRTISGFLDLREFGLSLCHSLLKRDQIRCFDRGLSASKNKPHLISPCLRLLTEIVAFDGGVFANRVYERRDVLYKRLDNLLEQQGDTNGDRRKPTVRRMSLRLVIANLKFLDSTAKAEFVTQMRMIRSCVHGLISDGDDIVVDILQAVETGVIEDSSVPRTTKVRFLNPQTLASLAALYEYDPDPNHTDSAIRVREATQTLLLKTCTTRKGISLSQSGWYPVGYDISSYEIHDEDCIDLGLDSPLYFDEYTTSVPVKNTTLSTFCQTLSPETDTLQSQLLLQIFRSAPELVSDYFSKRTKFGAELSGSDPAYLGLFAFLFSIAQLPIPKNFGLYDKALTIPPPTSVVVESILPRPFDRTTTTKLFASNDEILVLSGAQLMNIALNKTYEVLQLYETANEAPQMWQQATARLVEAVLQRSPKFKDVVDTIKRFPENEPLRSALFECIATFHQVLPEATAGSNFDIGPTVAEVLARLQSETKTSDDQEMLTKQLLKLMVVVELSPSTKWFNKSDAGTLSLFSSLMKFTSSKTSEDTKQKLLAICCSTAVSAGFLNTDSSSFTAFVSALEQSGKFTPRAEIYLFVDNAIHRATQKPVRYLDRIESVQEIASDRKPLSLLSCSVAEQWEFALKKYTGQKEVIKNIADWIARFFGALESIGENFRVLGHFKQEMMDVSEKKSKEYLQKSFEKVRKKPVSIQGLDHTERSTSPSGKTAKGQDVEVGGSHHDLPLTAVKASKPSKSHRKVNLMELLGTAKAPPTNIGNITLTPQTDIDALIHSGRLTTLFYLTCSTLEETRLQTFSDLQSLIHILEQSSHPDKSQLTLLTGELLETIRHHTLSDALPTPVSVLATKFLTVLTDPTHPLFGKTNRFLLRSPHWDLKRLIPQWLDLVLYHEPDSDLPNAWTTDVEWLIQWLADSLITQSDMELYRRSGMWEKILALFAHPSLSVGSGRTVRKLILALVYRGIKIAGGADTLITRVGLDCWLDVVVATIDSEWRDVARELKIQLLDSCDSVAIREWRERRVALLKTK